MKAAISNAVTAYAAALPRNPLCIRPVSSLPAPDVVGQQATRIVELEGLLASARGENHDLRNDLAAAGGALRILALKLGLSEGTPPTHIVGAAILMLEARQ